MNPASRLHEILSDLKKQTYVNSVGEAVANVFELDKGDTQEVAKTYFNIAKLAFEVEDRIVSIPELDQDLFLESINNISSHLSAYTIKDGFSSFNTRLDKADIRGLNFISNEFNSIESESALSVDQLTQIEAEVDLLLSKIGAMDLPPELSKALLHRLLSIQHAVKNYRLFGADGIRSSVAELIGRLAIELGANPEDKKINNSFKIIFDGLNKINAFTEFIKNGVKVAKIVGVNEIFKLNG